MTTDTIAALEGKVDALEAELAESVAALELALEDQGWRRIAHEARLEFSREGLRLIAEVCRLMRVKNPLIRRACLVQRNYVFGQGVTATAAHPDVNAVLQAFWVDPKNQAALTGHQAMQNRDTDLMTDGNLFFALFTNPTTGRVRVRCLPADEVDDIVTDPDDAATPRYYLRAWSDDRGATQRAAYPDWRYTPRERPADVRGHPVQWDAPVMHVAPDKLGRWGVPELYGAVDWARAYREFLEDWATFTRALSRFAAKLTAKTKKQAQAAQRRLASTLGPGTETNPAPVAGSTLTMTDDYAYEPVRIGGANVSMDDGRRLLLMVAAAVGLPETFFGDASVGTLATARSLDRPTELAMQNRQRLHGDVLIDVGEYVVRKAATSPRGPLRRLVRRVARVYEPDDGTVTETVEWRDVPAMRPGEQPRPLDPSITISFPPVVAIDVQERMTAIRDAAPQLPAGLERAKLVARLVLEALGVSEIDSVIEAMFPEDEPQPAPPAPTEQPTDAPDDDAPAENP